MAAPCLACRAPFVQHPDDRAGYCGECGLYYRHARWMLSMVAGSDAAVDERAMGTAVRLVREGSHNGRTLGAFYRDVMATVVRGDPS